MKKILFFLLTISVAEIGKATLRVTMFSTPVTVVGIPGSVPDYHDIDVNNDGIDDVRFQIVYSCINFTCAEIEFESLNDQHIEAEYVNSEEGIAYTCGAVLGAGAGWSESVTLADNEYPKQFDGKGSRYLALRKHITTGNPYDYIFGWIKIECAQTAEQFTIYGGAYDDTPNPWSLIVAGEGECYQTGISENLQLPAGAITKQESILKVAFQEPLSLRLFDVSGKNIGSYDFKGGYQEYNLPQNSGVVFLQVTDGKKYSVTKFF